ncbi:cytochrome c oxidase subunit II [Lentibacillus cibarius]|uniref:Cytochrome c oxidase subunit 2 n=1 Tax=Lentibacillus cibarius TaxID=2583219 RepID=A0A5S3QQH1_9BACI|nr:cytochrome c oxidase subunit II [Lentibacillus cibarius]TMN23461.1 cytochrome c oxidase subunit II [Lentibacillus cibarius]
MKGWMGKIRAVFLLGLTALVLSACGRENLTALDPKGYGAQKSFDLIILSTVVMLFVLAAVMVVYTIVLIKYRKKKGQEDYIPKQVEGNKTLETIWTIIPIILLLIIAVPTVTATFDLADTSGSDDHMNIQVTGNQYWWHFNYEGQEIQTSQDMYIPVGEKVYLNMKSADVTHSFWLPTVTGKMDVNPDNENTMYIEAYEEGVYWGKCAEFCGPAHSLMDFKVIAVSQDEFDQWVADMQNVDPDAEPDSAVAQDGKALFEENNCMGCHAIGSSPVQVGPNLTDFGNRSKLAGTEEMNKENLVQWIMDPESMKPGNKMTGNYPEVSKDEAGKIAEYLLQLKPSEITPESAKD